MYYKLYIILYYSVNYTIKLYINYSPPQAKKNCDFEPLRIDFTRGRARRRRKILAILVLKIAILQGEIGGGGDQFFDSRKLIKTTFEFRSERKVIKTTFPNSGYFGRSGP